RCHPDEGAARQRALQQLTSLGLVARDIDLGLRGGVFEKEDSVLVAFPADVPAVMTYMLAKAAWPREPALREAAAGPGASSPSVEEEMYAVGVAVEGYQNWLEAERDKRQPIP